MGKKQIQKPLNGNVSRNMTKRENENEERAKKIK
jgi:hypothetical protein